MFARPARRFVASPMSVLDTLNQWGPVQSVNPASAVWPTTNKIFYCPMVVPFALKALQLFYEQGLASSGNYDIGIYTRDGKRIISSGTQAQGAGTSIVKLFDITDTDLGNDLFYMALTFDNTTGAVIRATPVTLAITLGMFRVRTETPGSFGLPATATWAASADNYVPDMGIAAWDNL